MATLPATIRALEIQVRPYPGLTARCLRRVWMLDLWRRTFTTPPSHNTIPLLPSARTQVARFNSDPAAVAAAWEDLEKRTRAGHRELVSRHCPRRARPSKLFAALTARNGICAARASLLSLRWQLFGCTRPQPKPSHRPRMTPQRPRHPFHVSRGASSRPLAAEQGLRPRPRSFWRRAPGRQRGAEPLLQRAPLRVQPRAAAPAGAALGGEGGNSLTLGSEPRDDGGWRHGERMAFFFPSGQTRPQLGASPRKIPPRPFPLPLFQGAVAGDPDSSNDYVNASPCGPSGREYIVTQGPLPNTIEHFWRMVMAARSPRIVMLCGLVEGRQAKCAAYFPIQASDCIACALAWGARGKRRASFTFFFFRVGGADFEPVVH